MNRDELGFSIIMTVYDQARELEEGLPAFLTQSYAPGYEVIVVDESSTDDTEDVLKLLKSQHPHLYSTFLPRPNRRVARRKMALSIGVKAAKHPWVIITDINQRPESQACLQAVADAVANTDCELILGYETRQGVRLQPFADLQEARSHILKAERLPAGGRRSRRMRYLKGQYSFIITRRDLAHEVLKFFDERIGFSQLLSLRLSVSWQNLCGRGSTFILEEPTTEEES